jgi:hypothetical protein
VWCKNWLLDERGVVVDVAPLEEDAKCDGRTGCLMKEDAKVWSKKRLLGRKMWQQMWPPRRGCKVMEELTS